MMTPENIFQNMSQNLARRDGFALTLLISLFFAGCFGGPLSPGEIDPLDTSRPGISLGTIDDGQPQDGVTPTTDGEGDDDNPITAVLPEPGVKETEESAQIDYALYAPERFEAKGFDQCKATNRAYIHGDAWPFLSNGRVICDGEYKAYWRCKKRGGECSALKSLKEHCNLCWNRDIYEKTYKDKLQPDGSTKDTLSPYDGKSRPEDCFFRNLSDARDSRGPDSLKKCDFRKQYVDPSCNTEVALDPCPDPNAGCPSSVDVRNYDYDKLRGHYYGHHEQYLALWSVIVLDGTWSYTGANEVAPNVRLGTVGNDGHYHSGGDHAKQIEVSDSRGFFAGYEVPIDRPITLAIAPGNWPEFQNGEWDSPWNKFYPWIIDCDRGSSGHCGEYMTDQRFAAITAEQAPEIPKTFTAAAGHHYYFDEKGLREWSSWSPNEPCVGPPPYIRNRLAHFHKTIFFSDDLANSMKVVSYSTATNDYNLSYRGLSSENYVEQFGIRYANGAEEANSNYKKYFFGGKRQEYGPLVFFPE